MKIRKSFFIRWLLSNDKRQQSRHSVIDIEHGQTGDKRRVTTLQEASEWMDAVGESLESEQIGEVF